MDLVYLGGNFQKQAGSGERFGGGLREEDRGEEKATLSVCYQGCCCEQWGLSSAGTSGTCTECLLGSPIQKVRSWGFCLLAHILHWLTVAPGVLPPHMSRLCY